MVVSRYAILIGIPRVDGLLTGPPSFGVSHHKTRLFSTLVLFLIHSLLFL